MVLEYGHLLGHYFDDNKTDKNADKSPSDHNQITDGLEWLFPMAEEIGDRIRQDAPWWTRYQRIQPSVDVKVPGLGVRETHVVGWQTLADGWVSWVSCRGRLGACVVLYVSQVPCRRRSVSVCVWMSQGRTRGATQSLYTPTKRCVAGSLESSPRTASRPFQAEKEATERRCLRFRCRPLTEVGVG